MANTRRQGQMKLGAFFHPTGNHVAAWLHPDSQIDAGTNFRHYVELAQTSERAKFDLIFLADAAATRDGSIEALSRWPQYMAYFEPLTLLAGLAAVTSRIGLVATATTSYNEPYTLARRLATLDLMSGGRAGWNVVTSSNLSESYNFGRTEHFGHAERYERAHEFVEVVKGLWDSWDDDAFVRDRKNARYFVPDKLHYLRHEGKHFRVRGPLNVARPPQGYPVFAQAGASDVGMAFAAEIAELLFTPLHELEKSRAFYREMKERMRAFGRDPDDMKVMPGLNPIVGRTAADAEAKRRQLDELIHPDVGRELLAADLGGFDLSPYPVEGPLPYDDIPVETNASKATLLRVMEMAKRDNLTIRQLYQRYGSARGQRSITGSAKEIADQMEEWFRSEAVDGFLVQPAYLPGQLEDFVELVIPELRRRGLFRVEYEGKTLRENLGLKRPPSRYSAEAQQKGTRT
ncbi:MAG TPA: LLM class flavin-dependent oxidoreductase, partial [Hyphomicrobiales bacterium]|nr:LLM class flavin-dependent oxidoreductase [Hyphomicrobiales bacterium]